MQHVYVADFTLFFFEFYSTPNIIKWKYSDRIQILKPQMKRCGFCTTQDTETEDSKKWTYHSVTHISSQKLFHEV